MSLIQVRKRQLCIETILHEGGPPPLVPLRMAASVAVIRNPYAGRYEPDLLPLMTALRILGRELAEELVGALGKASIKAYGKGAIVGLNGELEQGAVWHEAGGWALRAALGEPNAIVPAAKAVATAGYRLMVPLHHIHAAYVRSHFNAMDVGVQDGPRPDEILYALVAADGGRVHARLGGLAEDQIKVGDGQR